MNPRPIGRWFAWTRTMDHKTSKRGLPAPRVLIAGVALIGIVVALAVQSSAPKRHIQWETDLAQAADRSGTDGRPVMMYFTIDGCPPCRYLKKNVYLNERVADLIESKFVPLKLDLTDPTDELFEMSQALSIRAFPTVVFFDSDGAEFDRFVGAVDVDQMIDILKGVLNVADPT